jgi:hypothetical protein
MSKFMCLCKRVIWNGEGPCPYEHHFISDASTLRFGDMPDWLDFYLSTLVATLCPECRRLHLWVNGGGAPALIYRPASETDFDAVGRLRSVRIESPKLWSEAFGRSIMGPRPPEPDAHPPIHKLTCACNEVIPVEPFPSARRWRFMSDVDWEKLDDVVDVKAFVAASGAAILCPACKRLHLFPSATTSLIMYAPEEPRDWPTCDTVNADPALWNAYYALNRDGPAVLPALGPPP